MNSNGFGTCYNPSPEWPNGKLLKINFKCMSTAIIIIYYYCCCEWLLYKLIRIDIPHVPWLSIISLLIFIFWFFLFSFCVCKLREKFFSIFPNSAGTWFKWYILGSNVIFISSRMFFASKYWNQFFLFNV